MVRELARVATAGGAASVVSVRTQTVLALNSSDSYLNIGCTVLKGCVVSVKCDAVQIVTWFRHTRFDTAFLGWSCIQSFWARTASPITKFAVQHRQSGLYHVQLIETTHAGMARFFCAVFSAIGHRVSQLDFKFCVVQTEKCLAGGARYIRASLRTAACSSKHNKQAATKQFSVCLFQQARAVTAPGGVEAADFSFAAQLSLTPYPCLTGFLVITALAMFAGSLSLL